MENPPEDPKPEDLAKHRIADPITPSEREVFVGRIKELEAERDDLKAQLKEATKPKREEKKKQSALERFSPL